MRVEVEMPHNPAMALSTPMLDRVRNLLSADENAIACDLVALCRLDAPSDYVHYVLVEYDICEPDLAYARRMTSPEGMTSR